MKTDTINKPLVSRLKAQMVKKGLNPKTLAENALVGRSFVYDILNGKSTNPTSSKLSAIADELGVSVQYLLSGVNSALSPKQKEWADIVEIYSLQIEPTLDKLMVVTVEQAQKPYFFSREWLREQIGTKPEDLRAVFINGDSMLPALQAGDMVLVDITHVAPTPPGIFLIFDGVGLVPKRLEIISPNRVNVSSDNRQYASYEAQLSDLKILGKIVWLAREL
jgi:transcriptional regulator with XRE-family HTH domain